MSTVDIKKIREELEVFLRNQDIIARGVRGVTTETDSFPLLGPQTIFILKKVGVKNVRSVKLNGTPLTFGQQYLVDYNKGEVTVSVTTTSGDDVDIEYDKGKGDKIYTDYPRLDLDLTSYPRIGFDDISHANTEQALNAELIRTDILISMVFYARRKDTVLELWTAARNAIIANKKSFFFFDLITLAGAGPMAMSAGRHDKIVQKNQDFRIPYEYETG